MHDHWKTIIYTMGLKPNFIMYINWKERLSADIDAFAPYIFAYSCHCDMGIKFFFFFLLGSGPEGDDVL